MESTQAAYLARVAADVFRQVVVRNDQPGSDPRSRTDEEVRFIVQNLICMVGNYVNANESEKSGIKLHVINWADVLKDSLE